MSESGDSHIDIHRDSNIGLLQDLKWSLTRGHRGFLYSKAEVVTAEDNA